MAALSLLPGRDGAADDASVLGSATRARRLDADQNAPVTQLLWLGSVRSQATVSLAVPVMGGPDRAGVYLHLVPLIELAAGPDFDSAIPAEYWRGRIAVEGGWRVPLHLAGRFELVERVHFLSCTRPELNCNAVEAGGAGFETALSLVAGWRPFSGRVEPLEFFAALNLDYVVGTDHLQRERRVGARVGVAYQGRLVLWQLFFALFGGNDVGLLRLEEDVRAGLGLAMSLW